MGNACLSGAVNAPIKRGQWPRPPKQPNCLHCGEALWIPYKGDRNKKFCNNSCATHYNMALRHGLFYERCKAIEPCLRCHDRLDLKARVSGQLVGLGRAFAMRRRRRMGYNPAEAFAFVGELHRLAIEADCVIVAVLHENPGSADFGKTRGHLGSQLERKAETNLRLSKSEGVTTVWTDRGARHCDIPKTAGIRFEYSTLEGCHCLLDSANDARAQAAKDELTAFAASVFQGQAAGLSWSELRNRIMLLSGVKESGARARLQKMAEAGLIRKNLLHQWESAL